VANIESLPLNLPRADCLIVVPPLAHLTSPALGAHLLQACARQAGFEVAIFYMSAVYGALVGPLDYADLANAPTIWLLGDRLFARAAFGAPPLGFATERFLAEVDAYNAEATEGSTLYLDTLSGVSGEFFEAGKASYTPEQLFRFEAVALALAERVARAIVAAGYDVVAATTTFDQTAPAIAVLSRVKELNPATRTIIGGANCAEEMAHGVRSLSDAVDHVFSGESEEVFVRFLRDVRAGRDPGPPVIDGAPCMDMDAIPTPRFDDYFDQVGALPELDQTPLWLCYETSRGCWWGQKHHCTFCGLNGQGIAHREKSADRVVEELREILADSPTRKLCVTDNIMPWRYHKTLIPRLATEFEGLHLYYQQKANLTLTQVKNLVDAGLRVIQPGIEALDDDLLRLVRKGVMARQNVALLRYARSVGMGLRWNLLWGLPRDTVQTYERTLELIPKLHHLMPSAGMQQLALGRFSPYFDDASSFGVVDIRPWDSYAEVFPPHTDLERLAYNFQAVFESDSWSAPDLMAMLRQALQHWRSLWAGDPRRRPTLWVRPAGPDRYVLMDTRPLASAPALYLDDRQARAVLVGGRRDRVPLADWAIRNDYALDLDGWCVPLAVANYPLLQEFETRFKRSLGSQDEAEERLTGITALR
jgi:ribosomal peptide maturation radical SAM protein 1